MSNEGCLRIHQVVQVGRAAIEPVPDVVGLALAGPAVAAPDDAVPVPHDQGFELGAGHRPAGPADVQRLDPHCADLTRATRACGGGGGGAVLVHDQAEGGVAGQAAQRRWQQRRPGR